MPNARGTINTPVRFTPEERDRIEALRARLGLPTIAAVLRLGVERLEAETLKPAKTRRPRA